MLPFLMKLRRVGVVPGDNCCGFTIIVRWGQAIVRWGQAIVRWGQASVGN